MRSVSSIVKAIQKNIKSWRNDSDAKEFSAIICSYDRVPGSGGFVTPKGGITPEGKAVRGFVEVLGGFATFNSISSVELEISDWSGVEGSPERSTESLTVQVTFQTPVGATSEQFFKSILRGFAQIGAEPTVGAVHTDYSYDHAAADEGELGSG